VNSTIVLSRFPVRAGLPLRADAVLKPANKSLPIRVMSSGWVSGSNAVSRIRL